MPPRCIFLKLVLWRSKFEVYVCANWSLAVLHSQWSFQLGYATIPCSGCSNSKFHWTPLVFRSGWDFLYLSLLWIRSADFRFCLGFCQIGSWARVFWMFESDVFGICLAWSDHVWSDVLKVSSRALEPAIDGCHRSVGSPLGFKVVFFFRKNMILCFSPFSLEAPRSWPKSWNLMCCRFPARGVHSIDSVVGVSLVVRIIIISCLFEVIWGEVLQSCVVKIGKSWRGAHPKWQAMVAFALASWNDGNVGVWLCTTAFFEVKNCSNPTCSWVFCTAHQQHGALAALITW